MCCCTWCPLTAQTLASSWDSKCCQSSHPALLPSKLPISPLLWGCSPQALSVLGGPCSWLAPALQHPRSWSSEKSHPLPGTAWTTEQEVGAGGNYISRSVQVLSSDLLKTRLSTCILGECKGWSCFVYIWALVSYVPLFSKALSIAA